MNIEKSVKKVMIANRGEVARRVIEAVQALGYEAVAVYSNADELSQYVQQANTAVYIGESAPAQSYLNIERLVSVAQEQQVDFVHPGYGFLAENADFIAALGCAGIDFVGPCAEVVRIMGDKARARALVQEMGLPCVPGYHGSDQSLCALKEAATKIGFPLMIKAAAGGGGRGMRLVEEPDELENAIEQARSEAKSAFGNDALIIERAILQPRHIEVQVLADQYGHAIHLGERECSIQRRHQKLIEESPAPGLSQRQREQLGQMALTIVRALDYVGAGTIEFLMDEKGSFYFMEMNTRLQVEHAVTEEITGIDIVKWQLRIADGVPLTLQQEDVQFNGHAIEVRLTAEDVLQQFMPQTGTVLHWQPETLGGQIRVEDDLRDGTEVSPYYDSMIAKIIAKGNTRQESVQKLIRSLQGTVLFGLQTNQQFLLRCLAHPEFQAGKITTHFVSRYFKTLTSVVTLDFSYVAIAGLLQLLRGNAPRHQGLPFFVTGLVAQVEILYQGKCYLVRWRRSVQEGTGHEVEVMLQRVESMDDSVAEKHVDSAVGCWSIEFMDIKPKEIEISLGGVRYSVPFYIVAEKVSLFAQASEHEFSFFQLKGSRGQRQESNGTVYAPMTGRVIALRVSEGQEVQVGEELAVIEAMKMEHSLTAEQDGVVTELSIVEGEQVVSQQPLLDIAEKKAVNHA